MSTTHTATERFEVNTAGMRQLHADRHPEQLIKELIQNVFDEQTTHCTIKVDARKDGTLVTVEDDGEGFADITDAYTLMADTPKRMDPEKRGRFNLGDKEVISVSTWAQLETVGWTVLFPPEGGRELRRNKRTRGTKVTTLMPWDQQQADRLVQRLSLIRPPEHILYKVNGETIPHRPELAVHRAILPSVLQSNPGEPIRPTRRMTDIHILTPRQEQGWIHEMGIPIQEIDLPYDVDVMQKVPMPPNRDVVAESYLKTLYSEVLNAIHDQMPPQNFAATWVRTAIESPRITSEAVQTTIKNRYGDKVVTWSSETESNIKALDEGYLVLSTRSMSRPERSNLRELGGLKSSRELFPKDPATTTYIDVSDDPDKTAFAQWVREIGHMAGMQVTPLFVYKPDNQMDATCTSSTDSPVLELNIARLDDNFFKERGQEQLHLIIHELGHASMQGIMSHGPRWGAGCAQVGARVAMSLMQGHPTQTHPSDPHPAPDTQAHN